jgi:hypothetical protein
MLFVFALLFTSLEGAVFARRLAAAVNVSAFTSSTLAPQIDEHSFFILF